MTTGLRVDQVSKTFGETTVLRDLTLSTRPGEIRALVGENGSGKSTFVKILAGIHEPDAGGTVSLDGAPLRFGSSSSADSVGLRFVHQDLGLIPTLSVVDNLALGHGYGAMRFGGINWRRAVDEARRALEELGYDLDPRLAVGDLSMGERTAIAVARAISRHRAPAKLVVLDEPTAYLPRSEVDRLLALIGRLKSRGVGVFFISHRLSEVLAVSDSVTILRDGVEVATVAASTLDEERLTTLIVGRALSARTKRVERRPPPDAGRRVVLAGSSICASRLGPIDLQVRCGEVVGIAGITGSGREQVGGAVFGAVTRTGTISVDGKEIAASNPRHAASVGMGLVPANRPRDAAFAGLTARENVMIGDARRHLRKGRVRQQDERSETLQWMERLDVRPRRPEIEFGRMSGGNQQKLVLSRWLRNEVKVLVLDEPTQGIDVGAKVGIYDCIEEFADQGVSFVVISGDSDELAQICDRVVVLRGGVPVAEFVGADIDGHRISAATLGPAPSQEQS